MRKWGFHIFIVLVVLVFSCSPIKKANKKFKNGEYSEAIRLYSRLVNKPNYAAESNFKIGESYRLSNRILMAEPFYIAAMKLGYDNEAPQDQYAHSQRGDDRRPDLGGGGESDEGPVFRRQGRDAAERPAQDGRGSRYRQLEFLRSLVRTRADHGQQLESHRHAT